MVSLAVSPFWRVECARKQHPSATSPTGNAYLERESHFHFHFFIFIFFFHFHIFVFSLSFLFFHFHFFIFIFIFIFSFSFLFFHFRFYFCLLFCFHPPATAVGGARVPKICDNDNGLDDGDNNNVGAANNDRSTSCAPTRRWGRRRRSSWGCRRRGRWCWPRPTRLSSRTPSRRCAGGEENTRKVPRLCGDVFWRKTRAALVLVAS